MTLGIQTPGSFPLEYETFIHLIRQILIFTVTVINIWTYYKHIHKKWNKIAPPKENNQIYPFDHLNSTKKAKS